MVWKKYKELEKCQAKALFIDFRGESLKKIFKKVSMVNVDSYSGLKKIRDSLQMHTPVLVSFNGVNDHVRYRYIDFLSGMSSYFGAEMKIGR